MAYTIVMQKKSGHQTGRLVCSTGTHMADLDVVFEGSMIYITVQQHAEDAVKAPRKIAGGPPVPIAPEVRAWAVDLGRAKLIELGIANHLADSLLHSERMRKTAYEKCVAVYVDHE